MYMQILHNINVNSSNISVKLFHTKKGKNMQMNFMHKVAKIGLVASLFAALSLSAADSARSITACLRRLRRSLHYGMQTTRSS